jgi:hypothetical protein
MLCDKLLGNLYGIVSTTIIDYHYFPTYMCLRYYTLHSLTQIPGMVVAGDHD